MKKLSITGIGISLLFLFSGIVSAYDIPAPDGFVTDRAEIFSKAEEAALEAKIQSIEDTTTAEIGLLTIQTTNGEDIAELAFEVGNTWGVGKKENDNGLLILIAVEDRAWFMATGYGLEGTLPDAITKRIAEERFPFYFRDGLYADGVTAALNDIEGYLKNDPSVVARFADDGFSDMTDPSGKEVLFFMILLFASFFKLPWISLSKHKWRASLISNAVLATLGYALTSLPFLLTLLLISFFVDLAAMYGGKGGGGGSWHSSGSSGSSSSSSGSSSSSWGGSSGSGGGSFGGGSFGGGGSGGRW